MKILTELAQNPRTTLAKIVRENKIIYACFGYALGIISLYFAIKLGSQKTATLTTFFFTFIIWFISNIILNFVLAALCNIMLELTENKSSALGIFILLGLSQIIWTLFVPCFIITRAFTQLMPFASLFVLAILALQIAFVLTAIKQIYGTSRISSLIAFLGSFILPFVAGFLLVIFVIGFLIALLA